MNKLFDESKIIGQKALIDLIEWEPWPPDKSHIGKFTGKIIKKIEDRKAPPAHPYAKPIYLCSYLFELDRPIKVHDKEIRLLLITKTADHLDVEVGVHPYEDLRFKSVSVQVYATEDITLKDNDARLNKILDKPNEEGFKKYFNVWMRGDITLSEDHT